jgi:hypothetical protein
MFSKGKTQRGQALILIAIGIVGLVGMVALAIDGGNAYKVRRDAQNAADASALTAAVIMVQTNLGAWSTAQTQALNLATVNGFTNDGITTVTVENPPGVDCDGASGPYVGDDEYVQVLIRTQIDTFFAQVVGVETLNICTDAVARAKPGDYGAPFKGAGIVSLKPDGDDAVFFCGNANIQVKKSGLFVNSNGSCAFGMNGNITASVDTSFDVVGNSCKVGNVSTNGPFTDGTPVPYPPTNIDIPEPSITCTGEGQKIGNILYPGVWNTRMDAGSDVIISPGNYCLKAGADFNGNVDAVANDVNIKLEGGEFRTNGNSSFTCNNVVFFSDGGSGFHFNGNGDNNCTETVFYIKTGDVTWNGNVANQFTAPTSGVYENLLIYMPYENTSQLTINGNSGNHLKGTIMAIHAPIVINGNSGTETIDSQIIGYTVRACGNGTLKIDYDAGENVELPQPPTIELTK